MFRHNVTKTGRYPRRQTPTDAKKPYLLRLANWWIGKKHPWFHTSLAFAFLCLYGIGQIQKTSGPNAGGAFCRTGAIGFFSFILLVLLHENLHGSSRFLEHWKGSGHVPKKQIEQALSFCMVFFLSVTALSMAVAKTCAGPLSLALKHWLSSGVRPPHAPFDEMFPADSGVGVPDLSFLANEAAPPSAWAPVIGRFLQACVWLIVGYFLLLSAHGLLQKLVAWTLRTRQWDDDEKVYLKPTFFTLTPGPSHKASRGRFSLNALRPLSFREKIRRQYRRTVCRGMKRQKNAPACWASPSELEQAAGCQDPSLHAVYEKARYGPGECTREDWEKIRQ